MADTKIKACPFCGGEAELATNGDNGHWVQCKKGTCGACTNIRYSLGEDARPLVIEQWNRRQQPERDAERWTELCRLINSDVEHDTDIVFGAMADSIFNGAGELTAHVDTSIRERLSNG